MTVVRLVPDVEKLMSEFFDTHAYNEQADWREESLTDEDPDDAPDGAKDWNEEAHPRAPAGSSEGGEFTSGGETHPAGVGSIVGVQIGLDGI